MANLNDAKFVKSKVGDNTVFAKFIAINDKKVAVELPTGQKAEFDVEATEAITEDAYFTEVVNLVKSIQATLRPSDQELLISKEIKDKLNELNVALKELNDLKAQLNQIEQEKLAAARLVTLKGIDGLDLVDSDESKAVAKLIAMPESEFNLIKTVAQKAFDKVKSTIVEPTKAEVDTAVAAAKPEAIANVETVTTVVTPGNTVLAEFIAEIFNSGKNTKEIK